MAENSLKWRLALMRRDDAAVATYQNAMRGAVQKALGKSSAEQRELCVAFRYLLFCGNLFAAPISCAASSSTCRLPATRSILTFFERMHS